MVNKRAIASIFIEAFLTLQKKKAKSLVTSDIGLTSILETEQYLSRFVCKLYGQSSKNVFQHKTCVFQYSLFVVESQLKRSTKMHGSISKQLFETIVFLTTNKKMEQNTHAETTLHFCKSISETESIAEIGKVREASLFMGWGAVSSGVGELFWTRDS